MSQRTDLDEASAKLLVTLLGRLDALFWPFRPHTGSYRAEIRRLQTEYVKGFGSVTARAQGETNWKAAHFARNALIEAGLVKPQIASGQVVGLRLTAQGISDARAMIGDRMKAIQDPITQAIHAELLRFEGCEHSGKWMLENQLFGEKVCVGNDPTEWHWVIEYALPLLRCGAVESTSDLGNRCYFRAVDGVEIESEPTATATYKDWADSAYIEAFNSERPVLMRLVCEDGGIFIPMRVS